MNPPSPLSPRRSWRVPPVGLALAILLAGFVGACGGRTTYSTHAVGHSITAYIDGNTRSIETLPTSAIIRSATGSVTIERDRVRIDKNQWTSIPIEVAVDVTISRHTVRVKAGRVTIERTVSS